MRTSADAPRATPESPADGPLSEISVRFRTDDVIGGIVIWLTEKVDPANWDELISKAQSRMKNIRGQAVKAYPGSREGLTMERLLTMLSCQAVAIRR